MPVAGETIHVSRENPDEHGAA